LIFRSGSSRISGISFRHFDKKVSELTISYTRSDGSSQILTLAEILKRKEAFEMAYNPNDGIEIRWGAPENSDERSTCRRQSPPYQQKTMHAVRKWLISFITDMKIAITYPPLKVSC
jgi:hypothetical protein